MSESDASEQLRKWIESPLQFWEECAAHFESPCKLQLGSIGPVALVYEPGQIREVFQLAADAFECRQYNEHYRHLGVGDSILLQDGVRHRRQRRLIGPLLGEGVIREHQTKIWHAVEASVNNWREGELISPRRDLQEVTFMVMVEMIFGSLTGSCSQTLINAYLQSVLRQKGSWGPWRNFARLQPRIRQLLTSEITARRACQNLPGILTRIAAGRDENGELLGESECQDHVFTLLIAGVDSTAVSLTWALHWLSREPDALVTLEQELSQSDRVSVASIISLPYLDAVYRETLRMIPIVPAPSGRRLTRDASIGGVSFMTGTTLIPSTYLVHRRDDLYPDPHRFRPSRFLGHQRPKFEYFPFGGGVRSCIGETFAEWEFKIALAAILKTWTLETTSAPPMKPVRHGTLLAPPENFYIVVKKRHRRA
jgi:cytochrome P450